VSLLEMKVKTSRYERTVKIRAWSKGKDRSLIVIEAPAKDKGIATLKVDKNIWNYLPKVDRTMKVPSGMMSNSWMGSHFTNDDLVKGNRLSEQYTGDIEQRPADGTGSWVVRLTPKPNAPVVWGAVVVTVTHEIIPESVEYFDEDGALARTMRFHDVQEVAGRKVPMVMTLIPADKPDEQTQVTYQSLEFDVDLPESMFTLQGLKQ
jgi:outer membrane lipoprotein-sorting protein